MTTYTLIVEIPQAGKEVQCEVTLTGSNENHPEDYFRQTANRQAVQSILKAKLERDIQDHHLDGLITQWIQAIKRGKTRLKRQLDLHLNITQSSASFAIQDTLPIPASTEQNLPVLTSQERSQFPSQPFYPPKPPRPIQAIPKPDPASSQTQSPPERDNSEESEAKVISVESISNSADF